MKTSRERGCSMAKNKAFVRLPISATLKSMADRLPAGLAACIDVEGGIPEPLIRIELRLHHDPILAAKGCQEYWINFDKAFVTLADGSKIVPCYVSDGVSYDCETETWQFEDGWEENVVQLRQKKMVYDPYDGDVPYGWVPMNSEDFYLPSNTFVSKLVPASSYVGVEPIIGKTVFSEHRGYINYIPRPSVDYSEDGLFAKVMAPTGSVWVKNGKNWENTGKGIVWFPGKRGKMIEVMAATVEHTRREYHCNDFMMVPSASSIVDFSAFVGDEQAAEVAAAAAEQEDKDFVKSLTDGGWSYVEGYDGGYGYYLPSGDYIIDGDEFHFDEDEELHFDDGKRHRIAYVNDEMNTPTFYGENISVSFDVKKAEIQSFDIEVSTLLTTVVSYGNNVDLLTACGNTVSEKVVIFMPKKISNLDFLDMQNRQLILVGDDFNVDYYSIYESYSNPCCPLPTVYVHPTLVNAYREMFAEYGYPEEVIQPYNPDDYPDPRNWGHVTFAVRNTVTGEVLTAEEMETAELSIVSESGDTLSYPSDRFAGFTKQSFALSGEVEPSKVLLDGVEVQASETGYIEDVDMSSDHTIEWQIELIPPRLYEQLENTAAQFAGGSGIAVTWLNNGGKPFPVPGYPSDFLQDQDRVHLKIVNKTLEVESEEQVPLAYRADASAWFDLPSGWSTDHTIAVVAYVERVQCYLYRNGRESELSDYEKQVARDFIALGYDKSEEQEITVS